jgi:hypothetical protein
MAHSFLASYSNKPSTGHMKAALHTLHYIHSTNNYGISFTSNNVGPMHSFIHYLPTTDVEAYTDATPPTANSSSTLSSYSDACWGLQISSAVANRTLLPCFKFRSISGGIIFKNGSPLGWLSKRQECTSLSSCEAEICGTWAMSKKVMDLWNICRSANDTGFAITDIDKPTLLYNDNEACVRWLHNMTFKAARHIELRKNSVCKWVKTRLYPVKHISGKTNPADIFTTEMHDSVHFCCLRDSFMSCLSNFVNTSLLKTHHACQQSHFINNLAPLAAWVVLTAGASLYFLAPVSNTFCRFVTTMSHLSSSGCQLLRGLYHFIPSGLI